MRISTFVRFCLIGGGLLVLGCFSIFLGQNLIFEAGVRLGIFAPSPIRQYEAVDQTEAGWYNVFFTNPACLPEWRRHDGLDQLIADDIRSAGDRVDLAAFELNATPIISALRDVAAAGKQVRVVVDSAETEAGVMDRLRSAGVEIVGDERSALMHNKFVIIDDRNRLDWLPQFHRQWQLLQCQQRCAHDIAPTGGQLYG